MRQLEGTRNLLGAAALAVALLGSAIPVAARTPIADIALGGGEATWAPRSADYDHLVLTVSGPGGFFVRQEFPAGESPGFGLFDAESSLLPDGLYKWELHLVPLLDAKTRQSLEALRGEDGQGTADGFVFGERSRQSGSFSIAEGAFVAVDREEPVAAAPKGGSQTVSVPGDPQGLVLSNSDGVIRNSLCVGFDCPNSPTFSDSTILLMENNTRIKFGDTSVGSFPTNDWEIEANSNLSGGASYLGFNDCGGSDPDGGCATDLVFAVEAGARSSALYVESDGDVGIGTSNPVVELHAVRGDTPTLRLEQDGSSGFSPQTWDVAGNETSFFIRDASNGSTLPFRIQPGAPSNSVFIRDGGDVGIGTSSAGSMNDGSAASLYVRRSDGDASILIEDTGSSSPQDMLELRAAATQVNFALAPLNAVWQWQAVGGQMTFTKLGTGGAEMTLTQNGDMTLRGMIFTEPGATCNSGCDRVFEPGYPLESIEEHAAYMWENSHLAGVGPTAEKEGLINLNRMTGGILNELEKAHIYIEQLNGDLKVKNEQLAQLNERLARLEALLPPSD